MVSTKKNLFRRELLLFIECKIEFENIKNNITFALNLN